MDCRKSVFLVLSVCFLHAFSVIAVPRKVLAVVDAYSSWGTTRKCVCFYDITDVGEDANDILNGTAMFSVWMGYEDSFMGDMEEISAIAVSPVTGTVYVLAYDDGTPGQVNVAGDTEGDYDLYRTDYQEILKDWLANSRPMDTMYGPKYAPDHNYGGYSAEDVNHPDRDWPGGTIFIDNAIERIAELTRNDGNEIYNPDMDFVSPWKLVIIDKEKGDHELQDPNLNHCARAFNLISTTSDGNEWQPTQIWSSDDLGLLNMDFDSNGLPVGTSEPKDMQYYKDPVTGLEGLWIQESDGGGGDIAFYNINNWMGDANNVFREFNLGDGPNYPDYFSLSDDPVYDANTQDGRADIILVDSAGNLIIGETGNFDTPQTEPKYILRTVNSYDVNERVDFGPWGGDWNEDGYNDLISPTLDDDVNVTDGRFVAYDKGENQVYIFDLDSYITGYTPDLYVYDLDTGQMVYEEIDAVGYHWIEEHGLVIFTRGDVDENGDVDYDDMVMLLGKVGVSDTQEKEMYDLTADGEVTCADANELLVNILGSQLGSADINADGAVDLEDLDILSSYWLEIPVCSYHCGDLDGQNDIDFADFTILAGSWLE